MDQVLDLELISSEIVNVFFKRCPQKHLSFWYWAPMIVWFSHFWTFSKSVQYFRSNGNQLEVCSTNIKEFIPVWSLMFWLGWKLISKLKLIFSYVLKCSNNRCHWSYLSFYHNFIINFPPRCNFWLL